MGKVKLFGKTVFEYRSGDSDTQSFSLKDASSDILDIFFGGRKSKSGQIVNQETAIGFSAVTAGVRVIAETIASLSFNVHRRLEGGNQEIAHNHNLQYLVHTAPYHLYTSFIFRETMINMAIMWGNAYARIIRNEFNKVLGFEIIHKQKVFPFLKEGEMWYKVVGLDQPIYFMDMIHIQGFVKDGLIGVALTDIARESIGSGLAMQELSSKFFANGGIYKGIITTPEKLSNESFERIKKSWKERNTGSDNHWSEPILEAGMEYKPMTLSPEQSQLLESRKFQLIEVARVLRIPPHKLGDLSKSTNNNIEHQSIEFVTDCIRPWVKRIEGEFNRKIFRQNEQGELFTRLNLNSLLRGDIKARGEFYSKMFSIGAFSPNKILQLEGENTFEGGDERYIQGANIPLSVIKEKYQADVLKQLAEAEKLKQETKGGNND
ncbi:phage portal protein [Marinifilum flexuosum]|uniref:HK97 family phage portal protein n=1 Tax=Marinifilum flexuosum TaxID=1117708 RepID=A0A419WMS5_9BACT|nr:phage portal protein [Marinifilum flexuosum]RKD96775.1 HK97 family phage portal protein [Marinifilum flexuosum]